MKSLINDASHELNDTPLTLSIYFDGDLRMVKLLLAHGASKDKPGDQNKTPEQWAKERGKTDILKYLQSL